MLAADQCVFHFVRLTISSDCLFHPIAICQLHYIWRQLFGWFSRTEVNETVAIDVCPFRPWVYNREPLFIDDVVSKSVIITIPTGLE